MKPKQPPLPKPFKSWYCPSHAWLTFCPSVAKTAKALGLPLVDGTFVPDKPKRKAKPCKK